MATKPQTSFFIGTKRQITNQWVQWFVLALSLGILNRTVLGALGIKDRGWMTLLYCFESGFTWAFCWWLVRGKLGEFLNGPRTAEADETSFLESVSRDGGIIPTSVINSPTQTHYFPTGGSVPLERAPKRQPIRQPEED